MLWACGEKLSPVRSAFVRRQLFFDNRQNLAYIWPVLLPREVDGYAVLFVGGTHPEIIGGDGADFGDHQMWRDLVAQFFHCQNRVNRIWSRDKEFGLQLFAGAGREAHAEMWKAFVPGARNSQLFGAVLRPSATNRMEIFCRWRAAVEIFRCREFVTGFGAALDPDFREFLILPVGKQADAVGAGFDGVEVLFKLAEWKIFVDPLLHRVSGLDVERHFRDHA